MTSRSQPYGAHPGVFDGARSKRMSRTPSFDETAGRVDAEEADAPAAGGGASLVPTVEGGLNVGTVGTDAPARPPAP